jgi:2-polyprenyl-6-methoxyphenol hydroxylase-like FAD-dependent oxidoreductase
MEQNKKVLISGASFAGLSTAYWMNKLGYQVTVVEIASELIKGGTPVNIRGNTVDIVKRMGIYEQIKSNRLGLEMWEFKNADDVTEGTLILRKPGEEQPDDEYEIERNILLNILFDTVKNDVEFIFSDSIAALKETKDNIEVIFEDGSLKEFDFVFGCDGLHSTVRKLWFGNETEYTHFLGQYFSIIIVNKLLINENRTQMYSVPGSLLCSMLTTIRQI